MTDHASLKWLMGQKDLNGRLARWSLKLQGFNFFIGHRKGSANIVPDALSRAHCEGQGGLSIELDSPHFFNEEYHKLKPTVIDNQNQLSALKIVKGRVYKRTEFNTGILPLDAVG